MRRTEIIEAIEVMPGINLWIQQRSIVIDDSRAGVTTVYECREGESIDGVLARALADLQAEYGGAS